MYGFLKNFSGFELQFFLQIPRNLQSTKVACRCAKKPLAAPVCNMETAGVFITQFFHYSRSHFIYVSFIFISHLGFFQFIFWIFRLLESMNWDRFEVECLIMAFMSLLYENFRNSNIWSKSNWRFLIGLLWLWVNIRGLRKEIFKNRSFKSNFSALPAISTPYKSQKRIESNVYFNSRS